MHRVLICGLVLLLAAGCAAGRAKDDSAAASPEAGQIWSPAHSLAGRVVWVNERARFAVLRFPIGQMPETGRRMAVYRLGLKVGEVRISGPQTEDNIVADILAGDAATGDDIREE